MNNRVSQGFFLGIIIVIVATICVYGIVADSISSSVISRTETNISEQFSNEEKIYIKNNKAVRIYVDKDLQYLMEGSEESYLYNYLNNVFKSQKVNIELSKNKTKSDVSLMVINDKLRDVGYTYTAPLFEIEGAMYVKEKIGDKKSYNAAVMKDRVNKPDKIKYNTSPVISDFCDTADDAVKLAIKENKDIIIGDRAAVKYALENSKMYVSRDDSLYTNNVCIMVNENDTVLYSILNKCVHAADRQQLTYIASEKWLDGNGPLYMEDSNEDIYMMILIIIAAVLIAFFVYYQANKNLYVELNERMEMLAESKQELKTTFNGVGYYLAEVNHEGTILEINKAFYDFVKTDTVNRKVWDVIDLSDEDKRKLEVLVASAGTGSKNQSIEVRLKKRTIVIDVFPIENTRGSIEKLLFMAMDVTNERMAERQMLQDNKMIAVGQLAAGVAHEIRNPLGIIRNYCYVLKTMPDESVKMKAIEQIEKSVDRSGAIINNLLNFSRASKKNGEIVNIKEHIWSLVELNNNILKKKNINLKIECKENVKSYLAVESLDMILINLISNATDAMNESGDMWIRLLRYEDSFAIEVEDTGCGIEEDVLQDIFNPFFTTKGNNKGNGLGLYIAYNETDKLNGKIEVESKLGEGSKFRLTLPLVESPSGKDAGND